MLGNVIGILKGVIGIYLFLRSSNLSINLHAEFQLYLPLEVQTHRSVRYLYVCRCCLNLCTYLSYDMQHFLLRVSAHTNFYYIIIHDENCLSI